MRGTVSKWGNSLALRIPKGVADDAHLAEGTEVELAVESGRLVVARTAPAYRLEDLLNGITADNQHDLVFDDAPRGAEVW